MAQSGNAGPRKPTNLFEAAAWRYSLLVICRNHQCRHVGIFNPHQLWWLFKRKGWASSLHDTQGRMKCSRCGASGALSATKARDPNIALPWPSKEVWQREVRRFRS